MSSSKTQVAAAATAVGPTTIRIHDLAKQLGIPSKEVLEKAKELFKEKVKSHASLLTPGQADRIKAKLGKFKQEHEERESKTRLIEQQEEAARAAHARVHVAADRRTEPPPETGDEVEIAEPAAAETAGAPPALEEFAPAPETETRTVEARADDLAATATADSSTVIQPAVTEPEIRTEERAKTTVERKDDRSTKFGVVTPAKEHAPSTRTGKAAAKTEAPAPAASASGVLQGLQGPPKKVLTGPVVAPPVQRDAKRDDRFGVVVSAAEAEKIHGPAPQKAHKGGRKMSVDSKPVDDFKPQVSYPSIPESFTDEEERGKGDGK